jgi:hypothetical protein
MQKGKGLGRVLSATNRKTWTALEVQGVSQRSSQEALDEKQGSPDGQTKDSLP